MTKTSSILRAALAAITLGCLTAGAQAQLIVNGIFTDGVGSLNGWTQIDNSANTQSPGTTYDGTSDRGRLIAGDGIYQVFGNSYTASVGDQITVNFELRAEWNSPSFEVVLFDSGNINNVLSTSTFNLSGSFGPFTPYSINYTAVSADVGKTVGVLFRVAGVEGDDRWGQIDNVSASVAPIPEPSTYALVALGMGALVWLRRRARSA